MLNTILTIISKIKFRYILYILCAMIICVCIYLFNKNKSLNESVSILKNNEKAFMQQASTLEDEARVFLYTINQLEYSVDSIDMKLKAVIEENDINIKKVKQLQYLNSQIVKSDTVVFSDTIFIDPGLNLDTVFVDKWSTTGLHLRYPNTIAITNSFELETSIIVDSKRETIDPPKKYWICRIFQKKHDVLNVNVIEGNPYVINKEQKFIKIL